MITDEFKSQVAEALNSLGYKVELENDVITDASGLDDDVTLPGIREQNGVMTGYVRMKLAVLRSYLDGMVTAIQTAWNTWFGVTADSGVRRTWTDWFGARQTEWNTYASGITETIQDAESATQAANSAASNADAKASEAANVNAQLSGMTVTVTNRNGVSTSVNIGFDIYRTYSSVAAMNADAANVPDGKFVMIATTDKTSEDNAKLYGKNAQGSFTFLSDLDQASSAAWADWLENMKPAINERITTADSDHTRAGQDHTTASSDHTAATSDHTQAGTDHSTAQADHTQAGSDHTRAEQDHTQADTDHSRAWEDHEAAYKTISEAERVNATMSGTTITVTSRDGHSTTANLKGDKGDKGDDIDYTTMTDGEKQELADKVVQRVVSENVLGAEYDEIGEGIVFPTTMNVGYEDEGIILG